MVEDRAQGAAPNGSGKETGQDATGEGRRAYDPGRYSPVTVAAWQRIPASTARAFAIASARGRLIGANGADRIRSGRDVHGSVVGPKKLPEVLEALAESDRTWRRHILEWEAQYLAHRCSRGRVCLFTKALPAACPACGAEIVYDHPEKLTRVKRQYRGTAMDGSSRTAVRGPDKWP